MKIIFTRAELEWIAASYVEREKKLQPPAGFKWLCLVFVNENQEIEAEVGQVREIKPQK